MAELVEAAKISNDRGRPSVPRSAERKAYPRIAPNAIGRRSIAKGSGRPWPWWGSRAAKSLGEDFTRAAACLMRPVCCGRDQGSASYDSNQLAVGAFDAKPDGDLRISNSRIDGVHEKSIAR